MRIMKIGVVIPTHPPRIKNGMLGRAIRSVNAQTHPATELHVPIDLDREGGRITRARGAMSVQVPWTAFLDSDDEFKPEHLELLVESALDNDADYVYPWYEVIGGRDPRSYAFGVPHHRDRPNHHPSPVLVRTDLAQDVMASLPPKHTQKPPLWSDDFAFFMGCVERDAKIFHLPRRTWRWYHHGKNSSSVPGRGDAE